MLLHINGKFTIGKLGVKLKSFKHKVAVNKGATEPKLPIG
jgi:hypothetical protein